jgi:hypothetical protein
MAQTTGGAARAVIAPTSLEHPRAIELLPTAMLPTP